MVDEKSLINFGDLSKPATVLIEKVSNAVGVLYEPRRIVKKAEAEVKIERIKALASIELNEIQQKAMKRLVQQETRKQENIENITAQAVKQLTSESNPSEMDEDWIANFFSKCETVSDKEMQSLWSSLLSGEAAAPGTFSKRTVAFVSTLDKKDARLFTTFCQFLWYFGELIPWVLDLNDEVFTKQGINFAALTHLSDIGLVTFATSRDYVRKSSGKKWLLSYFETPTLIEFESENNNQLN